MQYRRFPKIPDMEISALGLGCMRLPVINGNSADIDKEKAFSMLKAAIDSGINYIDTAWPYHNEMSESWLGEAVEKLACRDKVYLATKSPVWLIKSESDWDKYLDLQLKRLRTDHIDFYLLHALGSDRAQKVKELKGIEFLQRAKKAGKILHVGFSFHDKLEVFKQIVDMWPGWEFCQVMYNYLDENYQAGDEGIKYAAEKALGVIIMEPLHGGALANIPKEMNDIFGKYKTPRTAAEWGLRYVLDRQEVVTVLSGMNSIDQIYENAGVAASSHPNSMIRDEQAIIKEAKAWLASKMNVGCTGCAYCKPCPNGVEIPDIFEYWNHLAMFGDVEKSKKGYAGLIKSKHDASVCTKCALCITKCPQKIKIPDMLEKADLALK